MRRCIAFVLLLLFLWQPSAVAQIRSPSTSAGQVDLHDIFAPLVSEIENSRLYAVLTGASDLYAAMHAPPPKMQRPLGHRKAALILRSEHALQPQVRSGVAQPLPLPPPSAVEPGRRVLDPLAMRRSSTKAASSAGTGIERWWSYEERAIPGIGRAMLNVGSGNLVVSAMDVDMPEQGIDLAFQRVYNFSVAAQRRERRRRQSVHLRQRLDE